MDSRFRVTVGAGTMMSASGAVVRFPHRWTSGGVTVQADFTGGHLLHLVVAGCVLNDVYREAAALGIELSGVRVIAVGGFDTATWQSTGIGYSVEVSSDAAADQLANLHGPGCQAPSRAAFLSAAEATFAHWLDDACLFKLRTC